MLERFADASPPWGFIARQALKLLRGTPARTLDIRGMWMSEQPNPYQEPDEGIVIKVIGGPRPLMIEEVGLELWHGPRKRLRRRRQKTLRMPFKMDETLPYLLKDGRTLEGGRRLGDLQDSIYKALGEFPADSDERAYVVASGSTFRARTKSPLMSKTYAE